MTAKRGGGARLYLWFPERRYSALRAFNTFSALLNCAGRIRVGLAGWSYPDWKGIVYPVGCKDTLRWCAEHVDVLEVNSTFYRIPDAKICAAWIERTRDLPVRFTAKVPQVLTHQHDAAAALLTATCAGFAPLAGSGRLDALLLQFSHAFAADAAGREHLRALVEGLAGVAPLVVEVRHASWQSAASLAFLAELAVSVANLDYPGARAGFGLEVTGLNGPNGLAYFRLHGRNAAAWFAKGAGRDAVYDWEYSATEVREVAERARAIAHGAASTLVIANNHFHGKAMKLVLELLAFLRGGPVLVPEPMLGRYPDLERIAQRRGQGRLFS